MPGQNLARSVETANRLSLQEPDRRHHAQQQPGTCPVVALLSWLAVAPASHRVFDLVDRTVLRIVKRAAEAAGIDPAAVGAHSLRSGCATQAARNGADERAIQKTLRHTSTTMTRKYIQEGTKWQNNATGLLGL
jgi:integrase